jgi:transcriptional regulator of arginine metabolism
MKSKNERHERIIDLVTKQKIVKQETLVDLLETEGFQVTQATVSRDIRLLKLIKVSDETGLQYYSVMQDNEAVDLDKYDSILKEGFLSAETASNILVVKTVIGMAMGVAAALDSLKIEGIIGSIAGDDTIFLATSSLEDAKKLENRIVRFVDNK